MSDESQAPEQGAPETPQDPTRNLKAEMDRKFGNINDQLSKIAESLTSAQQARQPEPTPPADDLEQLAYSDPRRYAEVIKQQTLQEVRADQQRLQQQQEAQNQVISRIYSDFPEVNTPGHKLYDKVQEMVKALPEEQRANPASWESLVYRAALETGVKPRALRKNDDSEADDFVMSGSRGSSSIKQPRKKEDVDPRTLEFARLMGMPVDKPEYMDRLKKYSKRDFSRYK